MLLRHTSVLLSQKFFIFCFCILLCSSDYIISQLKHWGRALVSFHIPFARNVYVSRCTFLLLLASLAQDYPYFRIGPSLNSPDIIRWVYTQRGQLFIPVSSFSIITNGSDYIFLQFGGLALRKQVSRLQPTLLASSGLKEPAYSLIYKSCIC